ncbi:MAG: hypothetical protein AAF802_11690 [Planctomycetota bacterium]
MTGGRSYKLMRFKARYAGDIQCLPRRVYVREGRGRLILRGDIAELKEGPCILSLSGGPACSASVQLSRTIAVVNFETDLGKGDYSYSAGIGKTRFPFSFSIR